MEFNASEIARKLNALEGISAHVGSDLLYAIVEQAPSFPSGWSAEIEANGHALGVIFRSNGEDNGVFGNREEFVIYEGGPANKLFGATREAFLADPVAALSAARTSIEMAVREIQNRYAHGMLLEETYYDRDRHYISAAGPFVDRFIDSLSDRRHADIRCMDGHESDARLDALYLEWLLKNGLGDDIARLSTAYGISETVVLAMITKDEQMAQWVLPGGSLIATRIADRNAHLWMDDAA